jgi:GGDEF domain-containing protein
MTYERFERFAIAIAALVVLSMVAMSARDLGRNTLEIVAELLLLAVFISAVHLGRRAGLTTAIAASAAYVVLSIPGMAADNGLTSSTLLLIAVRILVFGLVGIVGGEAFSRLRQALTRLANAEAFDEWSRVFNQRYAHAALTRSIAAFERYDHQFTIILISIARSITAELGPQRARTIVRAISKHLRGDVRLVDEVARLDDGRYFVLLPNTPLENGRSAAARLVAGSRQLLGAREDSVMSHCLSPAGDIVALRALAEEIAPLPDDDQESGEYSSAGSNRRNPALDRAESAPGPSTLKMSTAAAPEGSTKQ